MHDAQLDSMPLQIDHSPALKQSPARALGLAAGRVHGRASEDLCKGRHGPVTEKNTRCAPPREPAM